MFDLFLYLLNMEDGRELPDLPGHLVSSAPRRVSRIRSGDLLSILLTPASRDLIPEEDLQELLLRLAGEYFASIGSVTNGIRSAVEIINDLVFNSAWLSDNGSGGQSAGTLNLAVLHGNSLFIAHVGATHSILFSRERVLDMFDPPTHGTDALQPEISGLTQESISGLGAARTVQPRFYQQEISSGDLLIQCAKPSSFWSENELRGSANLAVDGLRRRLLLHPPLELYAALIQFSNGKGEIHRLEPRKPERQAQITFEENAFAPDNEDLPELNTGLSASPRPPMRPAVHFAENLTLPGVEGNPLNPSLDGQYPTQKPEEVKEKMVLPLPDFSLSAWQERADRLVEYLQALPGRIRSGIRGFRRKVSPGSLVRTEPSGSFPASTLLFIAVAVPVLVVAIATTIYFRSGKSEQRQAYLLAAQQAALQAAGELDTARQRELWDQSLYWVIKAEEYGQTADTRYLYGQARSAIDSIDGVVRLPMQLAVTTGLPADLNITKIAASSEDVFLLNGTEGNIVRLTLTDLGFEVDPKFNCGPGPSGAKTIGPLVDMFVLPHENQFNASLMAVDRSGNLLYCMPDQAPLVTTLTPPDLGWGKITAIAYANNTLYILDPPSKAVQRYGGSDYGFGGSPHLFFDEQIPKLDDVVDLTVYQDDLYLLHKSGQTTVCTYSGFDFSPTRCSDPAAYGNPASKEEITSFSGTNFTQLLSTQPPDPSLFYLDEAGDSIYHFSLRLNLQNRYRFEPNLDSPRPGSAATAMDVATNRVLYLAYTDQVFYAAIP